jgi:hypothetical protein
MKNIFEVIERKPAQVVIALLLFHIALTCMMSWIAHSPYLSHLHDGQGFWKFAIDSTLYHKEAVDLVDTLNSRNWGSWWSGKFSSQFESVQHAHVKWIAFLYWVSGEKEPLLFELLNSVAWVASIVLMFLASRILFQKIKPIAIFTVLYLFFPSTLLSSTQLLRDPFYILGFCFVIYGWVAVFHKDSKWKGVLAIVAGFYLISSIRLYVTSVMLFSFSICTVIFILRKKIPSFPAVIMLMSISIISFQTTNSGSANSESTLIASPLTESSKKTAMRSFLSFQDQALKIFKPDGEQAKEAMISNLKVFDKNYKRYASTIEQWKLLNKSDYSSPIGYIRYLDKKIALRLSLFRAGFGTVNWYANSSIDRSVQFMNTWEVFTYIPRALQIGFLSPFPHLWFSSGSSTGHVGRILAGTETLAMYIIFVGFFATFFIETQILKPIAPVLIFSGVIIVLLGIVIPNVGAIYRMRQGLFIPFFMIGTYGLWIIFIKIKSIFSEGSND